MSSKPLSEAESRFDLPDLPVPTPEDRAALRAAAGDVAAPDLVDLSRLEPPQLGVPIPPRRSTSAGWAPFRLGDEPGPSGRLPP
jgi:hypothetical protein